MRLTPKEFDLLTFLAQRPGRVVTHRMILKAIWGPNAVDQPEHLRGESARSASRLRTIPRGRNTSSQSPGSAIASPTTGTE